VVLLRRFLVFPHRSRPDEPVGELPEKGEEQVARRDHLLITSEQEEAMYATIRRYSTKMAATKETVDGLKRRIEEKFVPTIQDIRGFHSYGVLNVGDKELLSISIFDDRQGAAESTRKAAEFVQKDPLKDQLSKPEVLEGELLVLREAGVGVR
jgi:hypothetical protein